MGFWISQERKYTCAEESGFGFWLLVLGQRAFAKINLMPQKTSPIRTPVKSNAPNASRVVPKPAAPTRETSQTPARAFKPAWVLGGVAALGALVWWLNAGTPKRARADFPNTPNKVVAVKDGYLITPAPGWRTLPLTGGFGTDFIAQSPQVDKAYAANFTVIMKSVPGMTIQEARAQLPRYTQELAGYRQLAAGQSTLDGLPSVEHSGTFTNANRPLRLQQKIVLRGGRAFIFTATCLEADLDLWRDDIQKTFDSVRWQKK